MVRFAAIVDSLEDAVIGADLDGTVVTWNSAACKLFGYAPDEIVGESILLLVPPGLHKEYFTDMERLRRGERIEHYETQRCDKSGRQLEVSVSMSPIHDLMGRVIGVSKIARDISERRKLENARRLLAAIVESSDDAIISKNLDGIIMSWNAAAERLLGYKPEEMIGQSVLRIVPPELHFEEPGIISQLRKGERIEHFETRRMKKNGQIFNVSLTVSPIKDDKGRVIGGSKILRDISQRKAIEARLVEKEKLAAAGRLAATLAHEVNNPLESITNLAYLLSEHIPLDAEARHYADLLSQEVQRAGDITRQTLSYYRESHIFADVKLQEVVEQVLQAKRKKLERKNVHVAVDLADVLLIKGFHGELRQVFENLIDNAIDAVKSDGRIEIHAREECRHGGSCAIVSVCDDGPGIPPEFLPKLFETFFTTKAEQGSGLGLWVSRSIIEKHGGSIYVDSNQNSPSGWTVFTIELPIAGAASSAAMTSTRPSQVS